MEVKRQSEAQHDAGQKTWWRKYRGIVFALSSCFFTSLNLVVCKELEHYHPVTITAWQQVAILCHALPVFAFFHFVRRQDAFKIFSLKNWGVLVFLVVLRGVVSATAQLLRIWGLKYLSVADMVIISYSSSIFVLIFASICLGEKCGYIPTGVALLSLFGIALIARPPILTFQASFDTDNLIGVGLAFIAMLLCACLAIILRRLRKIHWLLILLSLGVFGSLETVGVAWTLEVLTLPVGLKDSLMVYVALSITTVPSYLYPLALKFEEAGRVALVGTTSVVFSFLLQLAFFGVLPDAFSLGGGFLVIFGVIVVTLRKWVDELSPDNPRKTKFSFLLL